MNVEYYGSVGNINHCYSLTKIDLSNELDRFESTNWINLRLMYSNENFSKKTKIDYRYYLRQEVKAKLF